MKETPMNLKDKYKEIEQKDIDKALSINREILEVFIKYKCTVNETYVILASMLESIYVESLLKEFGLEE